MLSDALHDKLDALARRLEEIDAALADPAAAADAEKLRALTIERAELDEAVALYKDYRKTETELEEAHALLRDPEMGELAQAELPNLKAKLAELEDGLKIALLPKDANDGKNVILEVRAGTGGDEAALFAADLLRMYMRYADSRGWKTTLMSASESDLGGYKEAVLRIEGQGAYSALKFESGAHRVQRVPATESQGRIHTSACTVAVLPERAPVELPNLNPADLRIDVFRASGAGGQHIQKTESAVRITHLPTGITAECQDERSQTQNKERAMTILASRLYAAEEAAQAKAEADDRRSQVGSGDRSERIRTYNFPQGRVTDHRINLTLYKLDAVLAGELEPFLTALATQHQAELLARHA